MILVSKNEHEVSNRFVKVEKTYQCTKYGHVHTFGILIPKVKCSSVKFVIDPSALFRDAFYKLTRNI